MVLTERERDLIHYALQQRYQFLVQRYNSGDRQAHSLAVEHAELLQKVRAEIAKKNAAEMVTHPNG